MFAAIALSADARSTAGVILLTVVAIEYGGTFMLRIVRGKHPVTEFQHSFARAGHAHAGVLVILALVSLLYADAAHLSGLGALLGRSAIPLAAILVPAGFFFSSAGRDATAPNRFIVLLYAGIASLGVGCVTLGVSLLIA